MPNSTWEAWAAQQANNLVSAGMGLALEGHNDKRQLKQQRKLQNLQIEGQQQMMNYSMTKEYEMWLKTNYQAQMEQMKKAGLNPGLMYGMGGGGGVTTGSPTGNVSGADAPKGGGEIIAQQGMGIQQMAQAELLKAQKDLLIAQTEKTKGEAANLPAAGENIKQSTANLSKQWDLMAIEEDIKGSTSNAAKAMILQQMRTNYEEMEIKKKEGAMTQQQLDAQLELMKAQAGKIAIDNELTKAQTALSAKQGGKIDEEINKIKAEVEKITDPKALSNYFERQKVRLMEKGINVAIISSTLNSILHFAR